MEKNKNKDIYKMSLHEKIEINDMEITRVPGGWLYNFEGNECMSSCFVKYHSEYESNPDND